MLLLNMAYAVGFGGESNMADLANERLLTTTMVGTEMVL